MTIKELFSKPITYIVLAILLFVCVAGYYMVFNLGQNSQTEPVATEVGQSGAALDDVTESVTLIPATATPSPDLTATPADVAVFEFTPTPIPATATPAPATATPFTGMTITDCPAESLGLNPNDPSKELIFELLPYGDADPEVLCHFELYSPTQVIKVEFKNAEAMIVADWLLGYQRDVNGDFLDECEEKDKIAAPECEGTWVAIKSFIVPKGEFLNLFVYAHEFAAKRRFTEVISWDGPPAGFMNPFACEYIGTTFLTDDGRTIVHSQDSIRVPSIWADSGTIYGFDRTLPNPLVCSDIVK